MTKLRKTLLATLPLIAGGTLWFGRPTQPAAATQSALAQTSVLVAPGRVEPKRDPVALAFETTGRIVDIRVDEGDAVAEGQILARLDDRMARARLASARASVAAAEANLALLRHGARREDLDAAKAELDAARTQAEHSAAEQARSAKLGESGAVASSAVDADNAAARVAAANAAAAQARYASLARGSRAEQILAGAAQLDAAKAELAAAEVALDQTLLKAPHAGIVLRRLAEVGALVTTMQPSPILSVADVSSLELRAEIDEADIAAMAVGKQAYATADAYGTQPFPVTITRITRELGRKTVRDDDPRARVDTRVLEVIARFDGAPAKDLPLGLRMYVHVAR